jgi:hypothetical protein
VPVRWRSGELRVAADGQGGEKEKLLL